MTGIKRKTVSKRAIAVLIEIRFSLTGFNETLKRQYLEQN